MAFVYNPNQPIQQQQNQQQIGNMQVGSPQGQSQQGQNQNQGQAQGQQGQQQQQGSVPQQGQPQNAPGPQNYTPSKSGRFTNLSNYIQANRGYNQNQGGFAGQIYGNVAKQAENTQNAFQQGQQQFNQQAEQNRVQYNQDLVNQAMADPAKFAQDQANAQSFQKLRDANYGGPTDIANSGQLLQQGQNIQSLAGLGNTEAGRYAMLNKLYGQPSYTRGQQSLDNLLLQSNPNQLQKLQQLNPLATNLNQNLSTGEQQAQDLAKQYQTEAQNTQQQTRGALNTGISDFDKLANQKMQDAVAQRQQVYQQAADRLGHGQITQADADRFGLGAGTATYNLDPSQYLSLSNTQATKQNVLNPEDYARIQALGGLAGNTAQGDQAGVLQSFQDPSQAGKFAAAPAYQFDTARFLNAQKGEEAGYNQQLNQLTSQFNEQKNNINNIPNTTVGQVAGNAYAIPGYQQSALQSLQDKYNQQLAGLQNQYGVNHRLAIG